MNNYKLLKTRHYNLVQFYFTKPFFTIDNIHVSLLFSQIIPSLPSSTESKYIINCETDRQSRFDA